MVGASCIEDSTRVALNKLVSSHAPNDITWITLAQWEAARWDGKPFNTCGKPIAEVIKFVFPSNNTMRGLRELFYETRPFADNVRPTVAEIDAWNVKVIQHFRNLIGAKVPVSADRCLFLRAQWASEKATTTVWDTAASGTCQGVKGNPHCGATFLPTCEEQLQYSKGNPGPCCGLTAGAEGIFTVNKDLPWSIKLSRLILQTMHTDGLGSHTGPFVGREFVGLGFSCLGTANRVVAKWNGRLEGLGC